MEGSHCPLWSCVGRLLLESALPLGYAGIVSSISITVFFFFYHSVFLLLLLLFGGWWLHQSAVLGVLAQSCVGWFCHHQGVSQVPPSCAKGLKGNLRLPFTGIARVDWYMCVSYLWRGPGCVWTSWDSSGTLGTLSTQTFSALVIYGGKQKTIGLAQWNSGRNSDGLTSVITVTLLVLTPLNLSRSRFRNVLAA